MFWAKQPRPKQGRPARTAAEDDFESDGEGGRSLQPFSSGQALVGQPHPLEQEGPPSSQRRVAQKVPSAPSAPETDESRDHQSPGGGGLGVSATPEGLQQIQRMLDVVTRRLEEKIVSSVQDLHTKFDSLQQQHSTLADRLTVVEERQHSNSQPVEALRATVEDLQVQVSSLRAGVEERLENAAIHDRAATMMVFGLSEQDAAEGAALQQAVNTKVVHAAQQHGLTSDSILEVKRLGAPSADADRPRPVLIRCRAAADKHRAFKARSALKGAGLKLDDCLTPAQMDARRAQKSAMDQLRQEQGANPHFRGARLHFWRDGRLMAYDAAQHAMPARQQPGPSGSRRDAASSSRSRGRGHGHGRTSRGSAPARAPPQGSSGPSSSLPGPPPGPPPAPRPTVTTLPA